jgi:hypothetical protein
MAPMSPASAISSMSVYALEHQNGFTAFRNCANAASTSTGGLDGLGAATLDALGTAGASFRRSLSRSSRRRYRPPKSRSCRKHVASLAPSSLTAVEQTPMLETHMAYW